MSLRGTARREEGMSLIEVLVALVVFTIGILAVVRIFPGGFVAVKHTENQALADRLAQGELERWQRRAANLPDGILAYDNNGVLTGDTDPDNMDVLAGLPVGADPSLYSDVNKFRHIEGEATSIPVPDPGQWDSGGTYVLGFGPIVVPASPKESVSIYSGPMVRRPFGSYLRSYSQYSIDYAENKIYVRAAANYDRQFVLKYSYWENGPTGPRLVAATTDPFTVAANTLTGMSVVDITAISPTPPIGMGIQEGSDSLRRAFKRILEGQAWNQYDPYEYKIRDADPLTESIGVISFSPYGYGYEEITTRGRVPLVANIDYDVLDWHVICEELQVSSSGALRLTLGHIKQKNEYEEADGSLYRGLYGGVPALRHDVVMVRARDGAVYTEDGGAFTVDYDSGKITVTESSLRGQTVRVYYKADGDWALQTYKTYTTYNPVYNLSSISYGQYIEWFHDDVDDNKDVYKIYLAQCYSGRSVYVDFRFRDIGGVEQEIKGAVLQLKIETVYDPITDELFTLGYVDLETFLDDAGYPGFGNIRVTKVRGVTVGARVIWREGGRGFTAGRWRQVDQQTYLTRAD
ncbi:MAG: prepilin-type N-terminal cleavage/methylation domain-containing protein [Armatimonadota bacterium]